MKMIDRYRYSELIFYFSLAKLCYIYRFICQFIIILFIFKEMGKRGSRVQYYHPQYIYTQNTAKINELQRKINQQATNISQLINQNKENKLAIQYLGAQLQEKGKKLDKLEKMEKDYLVKKKQLKNLKDPKKFEQTSRELFKNFVNQLQIFSVYNPIPKVNGIKFTAVIGEISAGKSSIYNWLFGLNLKTGHSEKTQDISKVHCHQNIVYFDSPGLSQHVEITNADILKAFYSVDNVFVATAVSFKNSIKTIQVFDKINPPKFYLVRTQCDKFDSDQEFNQAVDKDHALLQDIGIKRQILYISAYKGDEFKDNAKFKKLMLNIQVKKEYEFKDNAKFKKLMLFPK